MRNAKSATRAVYERRARAWDQQRPRSLYERTWLKQFVDSIPAGCTVLDLGCGAGEPVAEFFINCGFEIIGVDYAETMIALARSRFPDHLWLVQDMCCLAIDKTITGAISWDGFFHLSPDEQRSALPKIAQIIEPGGALMMTVGSKEGETIGTVVGDSVYHGSLGADEYCKLLSESGFQEVSFEAESDLAFGRSILFGSNKQITDDRTL